MLNLALLGGNLRLLYEEYYFAFALCFGCFKYALKYTCLDSNEEKIAISVVVK